MFYDLLPVLYGEVMKGWAFGQEVSGSIGSYYQIVKGFNSKFCAKISLKAAVCERLMLCISGKGSAVDCLKAVYRQIPVPFPSALTEVRSSSAIQLCLMDLFHASDPYNQPKDKQSKGEPLGLLAERAVMFLTGSEDESKVIWACEHISSIPVLNVYGQVSEMYIKVKKEAKSNLKISGI